MFITVGFCTVFYVDIYCIRERITSSGEIKIDVMQPDIAPAIKF